MHAKDGAALPDTGFPRVSVKEMSDNTDMVQTKGATHTSRNIRPRRSSRCYTSEACIIGAVRVGVEEVVEVDVLGRQGK